MVIPSLVLDVVTLTPLRGLEEGNEAPAPEREVVTVDGIASTAT